VVFGVAVGAGVIASSLADILVVVVSLSLALTPILILLNDRVFKFGAVPDNVREFDKIEAREHRVVIAGFGRVGQIVARMLRMRKIPFTVLESSFEQVDFVRKFGNKIYFGDASRLDLLRAAGVDKAEVFVLAIDDVAASIRTAELVKKHFPHVQLFARARNRHHVYQLMDLGVDKIVRETFTSSLDLAQDVLQGLGMTARETRELASAFRRYDEALILKQHPVHHDQEKLIATSKEAAEELERLFEQDTNAAVEPQRASGS
jgi:glutathione-regulated potassium-efflux system ancillary protein KefC/glutathione-regulated potassium-efflux system protein KefB